MEAIRTLYVGDGGDVVDAPADALERSDGFAVDAVSADEGVARLDDDHYDCLVAEYDLPDTDGVELLERVRADHPVFPFVMVATEGDERVASAAVSAGVTEYVRATGPATWRERLPDRVRAAVDEARERRSYREDSRLLDQLFEQVPVSLYVKDEAGRHVRMSRWYENDPEAVRGKTDLDVYGPDGEETYRDDRHVIDEEEPLLDEVEYLREGEEVWNLTSKVPWYGEDGEVKGLIGVTRRINERKEYELELRKENERLEEFASVVSHDLRNPIHLARAHADLAREECDSDHLTEVVDALDRMEALITDLLTLARQGQQVEELAPVSLETAVANGWRTVDPEGATLVTDASVTVRADRDRLAQLLENVIDNAVTHGSTTSTAGDRADDGVTVTVGVTDDGFYVADDGPGIPADERDKVFDAGYSTAENGTGFGLNIVAEIAAAHDWEIDVTESESGGARFEFSGVDVVE